MFKKIFCIFIIVLLSVSVTVVPTSAYTPTNFEVDAEGAMLVNMDTGDVLYQKNIDKKLYPASLTKLMTALVLYENSTDVDSETITVSDYAIKSLQGTDSSTGGLKVGEILTVRQMLYVLLMSSANEGANAIAEHVAGNVEAFCEKMNQKAQQLGMLGTHYVNAHGLHDVEHYTTVSDMHKLTTAILSVDVLKEIVNTAQYKLSATNKNPARTLTTTNFLMLNNGQKCISEKYKNKAYYYKYAKGVKTGYTNAAGRCLVSTASKNGYNYMCILMNSPVLENGKKIRMEFGDSKALYEWAFNEFEYKTMLSAEEIVGEVPIDLSSDTDFISAVPEKSLSAIVPKIADSSTVSLDIRWYEEKFSAPIEKGDFLGECDVVYAGEVLGTVTLVASQDVERSTFMYVGRGVGDFFSTLFGHWAFYLVLGIIAAIIIVFIISLVILNSPKHKKKKKNRRY